MHLQRIFDKTTHRLCNRVNNTVVFEAKSLEVLSALFASAEVGWDVSKAFKRKIEKYLSLSNIKKMQ